MSNKPEMAVAGQLGLGTLSEEWSDSSLVEEGYPGQWRLSRIDVANWGTFGGYHSLPVDRKGLLITGASGSGKSSLLDAVTTVLTPPRNRHLNAAARSGASKGEDRTLASYIRGAYKHEVNDVGEVSSSFLRARKATWSGIMLRYENGLEAAAARTAAHERPHGAVNLLILFNLKANSNSIDGISQLYAVVRGDHTLSEFESCAVNGIDSKRMKADFHDCVQIFREHSAFEAAFCRQLGIAGPKTLELLHKTQAAKNFGSLDELFRNFMLDRPKTFDQADEAVEQFTALSQAYAGVVKQREQMCHLEPLVALGKQNAEAQDEIERLQRLATCLPGYTAQVILGLLRNEHVRLGRASEELRERFNSAKAEQQFAKQALDQAQRSLGEAGGGALDMATSQLLTYERQLEQVRENRSRMLVDLKCAGVGELPRSYWAWQDLRRETDEKASAAQAEQEANRVSQYRSYGRVPELQERIKSTESELRYLRRRQTNIPQRLHRVREDIARHLGLDPIELPFVGELVSVKPAYSSWRGAIERLLENRAKTLLVTARIAPAVSRYVESRHLGVRLEFIAVPVDADVPKRSFGEGSLVSRLAVKHHATHPEYSNWVNRHLRERFDYACVETPDELSDHRFALTIGGQIKRDNRYVKDDRFKLDDRTRWVLGDDNDEKVGQFLADLKQLKENLMEADSTARRLSEHTQRARDLLRAKIQLDESDWSNYDIASAEDEHRKASEFCRQLSHGNVRLERAAALRDEAQKRNEAADKATNAAQLDLDRNERLLSETEAEIEKQTKRVKDLELPNEDEGTGLVKLFKQANKTFDQGEKEVYQTSLQVQNRIASLQSQAQSTEQKTRNQVEHLEYEFGQRWQLEAADLSSSFADLDAYLALYHQIKATGLPDYEQRFMHVLHDFGQDQITVIASTIHGAFREVKEKLIPVNDSLRLSNYSPTTHLQIKAKDAKSVQVSDFLKVLKEITQGSWDESDMASAEARFNKTNAVIKRLKSSEYADTVWRRNCLDTRQHVSFIANEIDASGTVVNVHSSDTGLSGGQKQKLVIFCLAAALRYQLADADQPLPRYGTVVLDEAFDKADPAFARIAMDIFQVFGFHMILATPYKLITVLAPYIGAIATVTCQDSKYSNLTLIDITEDGGGEQKERGDDADDG